MNMLLFNKISKKKILGFTLIEILVSLAVLTLMMGLVFNTFYASKKSYTISDELTNIRQNARAALELMSRDVRMMGYGIDLTNNQSKICYAGPYSLIFNANLDCVNEDVNLNGRLDTGEDLNGNGLLDNCVDVSGQQVVAMVPGALPTVLYNPPMQYTSGAETVRFTMDTGTSSDSSTGYVTYADNEDNFFNNDGDVSTKNTQNPHDYFIMNDINGAGLQPISFHTRGWGGANDNYPNSSKSRPMPLFQYWGHFYDNPGIAPADEPLDLWGDTNHDGVLENSEIIAWVGSDTPGSTNVGKLVWATEDNGAGGGTAGDGILNGTEDRNGNGLLDTSIDDVVRRIVITVTVETPTIDKDHVDPIYSSSNTKYNYYVDQFTADIMPRNLQLKGAPGLVISTPATPVPSPSGTTPVSSVTMTMTRTMTLTRTPTMTRTLTPTMTVTATPTPASVDCLVTLILTEYPTYWEVVGPVYAAHLEKSSGVINYLEIPSAGRLFTSDTGSGSSGGYWGYGNILVDVGGGSTVRIIHGQETDASVQLVWDKYFEKKFAVTNTNGSYNGTITYYFRPYVIQEDLLASNAYYSNINFNYNTILNDYNGTTVDTTIPSSWEGPITSNNGRWSGWDTAYPWFAQFTWFESGGSVNTYMHRNDSNNSNTFAIGRNDTCHAGITLNNYHSFLERNDSLSGTTAYTDVVGSYWNPANCIIERTPCQGGQAKGTYNGFKPKYGAYDFTASANEIEFNIYCTRKVYKPVFHISGFNPAQKGAVHVHPACDTGSNFYECDMLRFGVWKEQNEAYVQFKFDLEPGTYHYVFKPGDLQTN
jgi:hypothetical protein